MSPTAGGGYHKGSLGTREIAIAKESNRNATLIKTFLIVANLAAFALLAWFLKDIDWAALWSDVQSLHWGWIATAVFTDIAVYYIHAWRWKLLLRPLEDISLWKCFRAIYVGLFANEVLPLRTGEIIRCFLLSRWSTLPLGVTLSSFVVERVMDGFWLLLCLIVSLQWMDLPAWATQGGYALAAVIVVAGGLLLVAAVARDRVRPFFSKYGLLKQMLIVADDLAIIGHSRFLYYAFAISLPYLLLQVMPIYATAMAYGLDVSPMDCFVLMVVLRLSAAVPQAPGNVGVYQQLCKQILKLLGVENGLAGRVSLVIWSVVTLPLIVVGLIALAVSGANIKDLHREAEQHMSGGASRTAERTS